MKLSDLLAIQRDGKPDTRVFTVGAKVKARVTFTPGCPPHERAKPVNEGTMGTVDGKSYTEFDRFRGHDIRMVPVKWSDGRKGTVIDSLLELEQV